MSGTFLWDKIFIVNMVYGTTAYNKR